MERPELTARLVNVIAALEGPRPPVAMVARCLRVVVDELNRGSVEGFPLPAAVAHAVTDPIPLLALSPGDRR